METIQQEETAVYEHGIHRWGISISEAILDSECSYFTTPGIDGFIGYRLAHGCAIVIGDPICAENQKPQLAEAFQDHCKANNIAYIYFLASQPFAKWAIKNVSKILIGVGEEIIFDPSDDPTVGHKGYRLRNKIHHAQHLGLSVKEYLTKAPELEKSILLVGKKWLKARKGPQIYIGDLNFFSNRSNRRWFYLEDAEQKIIGMALLRNLQAHEGWLLKFLITVPEAPRGSSELLMTTILDTLRKENCRFLTYGTVPADLLNEISGLNGFSEWTAKIVYKSAKLFFHLGQRKVYWQQFHPHSEKTYLLFSSDKIGIKELRALSQAMKINL